MAGASSLEASVTSHREVFVSSFPRKRADLALAHALQWTPAMTAHRSIAAVLLTLALVPTPAFADVSDADRATARALTLEGYEALDRKDFATAGDRFKRADELFHVPTVTLGLAHAEVGQGKLVSALATCSRIVREGVPPNAPAAFVKAVDDARREIDALATRIPSVIISVNGPSASVTVDGVALPSAALGVKRPVDPGAHVIRAQAPGFVAKDAHVTLLEGKVETVTLELEPEKAAPAPVAPVVPTPVAAPPPITAPPPIPPPSPSPTQRYAGFATLGLGGVGLAVGAITGGLAIAKHGDITSVCPNGHCTSSQEPSLGSEASAYSTLGAASTGGFIAGGALAATGAILLLTAPRASSENHAAISPMLGLGFVGAEGKF